MSSSRADAPGAFDFDVSEYPELPTAPGLLVTGSDTEVGKTFVAGAVVRSLRRRGRRVGVFKPVASGCRPRGAGGELVSEDAEFLAACAETSQTLAEITPVRFRAAVAPNVAAERAHRPVDLGAVFEEYRRLAGAGFDAVVVEGVGGLLCPISDDFWVIHLARMLRLPLVIVARPSLGTINHTLLTIHAARSAGLRVAGVVINRYPMEPRSEPPRDDAKLAVWTNRTQIAERGRVEVLATIGDDPENSVAKARISPDAQYNIDQVDWERIIFPPDAPAG